MTLFKKVIYCASILQSCCKRKSLIPQTENMENEGTPSYPFIQKFSQENEINK